MNSEVQICLRIQTTNARKYLIYVVVLPRKYCYDFASAGDRQSAVSTFSKPACRLSFVTAAGMKWSRTQAIGTKWARVILETTKFVFRRSLAKDCGALTVIAFSNHFFCLSRFPAQLFSNKPLFQSVGSPSGFYASSHFVNSNRCAGSIRVSIRWHQEQYRSISPYSFIFISCLNCSRCFTHNSSACPLQRAPQKNDPPHIKGLSC